MLSAVVLMLVLGGTVYLLLPTGIVRDGEPATRVRCASHLRQIGQALLLYQQQFGEYPPSLAEVLATQDIGAEVFICPDSSDTPTQGNSAAEASVDLMRGGHLSYVYVPGQDPKTISPDAVLAYEPLEHHNGNGAHFLFADGHVELIAKPLAQQMIVQLQAGGNPPATQPNPAGS
jgi:prepilin-type processing-associated H-X9-DG protein